MSERKAPDPFAPESSHFPFVRYMGDVSDTQVQWGGNDDPRGILVPGKVYEVADMEVHASHTKYVLRDIKGRFNSVNFVSAERPSRAARAGREGGDDA